MNNETKLTILLPTYNRADWLADALSSMVKSPCTQVSILVIDNNSTDHTAEVVSYFSSQDPRIKYFKNKINVGPTRTLFIGFLKIETPYFTILCDRDHPEVGYFDTIINVMDDAPTVGVLHSTYKNKESGKMVGLLSRSANIKKGINAAIVMFSAASMIHGLTFRTSTIKNSDWTIDNSLYAQVWVAGRVALRHDAMYLVLDSPNALIIPHGITDISEISRQQNRPLDWGIKELFKIARDLCSHLNDEEKEKYYLKMIWPTILSAKETFFRIYETDTSWAFEYLECIAEEKEIANSDFFWGQVIREIDGTNDEIMINGMKSVLNRISNSLT